MIWLGTAEDVGQALDLEPEREWSQYAGSEGWIVTTPEIRDQYLSLLTADRRYTIEDAGSGGFQQVVFRGHPLIANPHTPPGRVYFVSRNGVEVINGLDAVSEVIR